MFPIMADDASRIVLRRADGSVLAELDEEDSALVRRRATARGMTIYEYLRELMKIGEQEVFSVN